MSKREARRVTTQMDWDGKQWIVTLLCDGRSICDLTLDEWAGLSATQFLVSDALEQAVAVERDPDCHDS